MMELRRKKILIISPELWSHVFVSKHHYAIELRKRENEVVFLNPPSKEWNLTLYEKGIKVLDYPGFPSGLRYLPAFVRKMIVRKKLRKIERMAGITFDIIWSFDNSVFYDFDALSSDILKVSHIVDLNMNFQLIKAAATADICFCTTELIQAKLVKHNTNVFKINHGYRPYPRNSSIRLPGKNELKAVYVGNLAMAYLDWDILCQTAQEQPKVDFIFFGPDWLNERPNQNTTLKSKEKIKSFSNCYFPGKIKSSLIPNALANADILMVAYQEKYHRDQGNPHKLMEYLSSGKPIVGTYTAEYDGLELMAMSNSNQEWPQIFGKTLKLLSTAQEKENSIKRINFANQNTYPLQLDRMEEKLKLV